MKETAGVEKLNSKKGFKKNEQCDVEGVLWFSDSTASSYKLVKAQTVPKVINRNPGHATGICTVTKQ